MDDALIFWRALHFAATIQVAGVLIFFAYVMRAQSTAYLGHSSRRIFWVSLTLAFVSGAELRRRSSSLSSEEALIAHEMLDGMCSRALQLRHVDQPKSVGVSMDLRVSPSHARADE